MLASPPLQLAEITARDLQPGELYRAALAVDEGEVRLPATRLHLTRSSPHSKKPKPCHPSQRESVFGDVVGFRSSARLNKICTNFAASSSLFSSLGKQGGHFRTAQREIRSLCGHRRYPHRTRQRSPRKTWKASVWRSNGVFVGS